MRVVDEHEGGTAVSFLAQYHGTCEECGETIAPGQRIERVDDEYEHVNCGARAETADCVCERCFCVHAGECI